jgi:hypothetical protein
MRYMEDNMAANMVGNQGYTEYTLVLLPLARSMGYIPQGTTFEEGSNSEGRMYKGYTQEGRIEGNCRMEDRLLQMSSMLDIDLDNREIEETRMSVCSRLE